VVAERTSKTRDQRFGIDVIWALNFLPVPMEAPPPSFGPASA
jgi:hypothetical protein